MGPNGPGARPLGRLKKGRRGADIGAMSEPVPQVLHNGQPVPVAGWFSDVHGHQLFLQEGSLVPACPYLGFAPMLWRLVRELDPRRDRKAA